MKSSLALLGLVGCAHAAPAADLVPVFPDYDKAPFNAYSGFIDVPGPIAGYDALKIHYEFHESQGNPATDPVATWHQGGPGGSSMYGAYGEMGYFQQSDSGATVNKYAWNRIASMLYLESPAGSGGEDGYSQCIMDGKASYCSWDDKTQAVAYAATLVEFFKKFPEFASNDLYLTGESYAGQYLPNIASYILKTDYVNSALSNFKGIAVGNGCWGGDENTVDCNGPNTDRNNVELFHGKGLASNKVYDNVVEVCGWNNADTTVDAESCKQAYYDVLNEIGPFNVYDIYDNCPGAAEALKANNKTMAWLLEHQQNYIHNPVEGVRILQETMTAPGGYDWLCGGMSGYTNYLARDDVRTALHLGTDMGASSFTYADSGPASVTLYPDLIGKIRILIYNGDADACVPYVGNEEWTTGMVTAKVVTEKSAWHPWYSPSQEGSIPAGYATAYTPAKGDKDFTFVTVRLAGHMVPQFQPAAAFDMFQNFLNNTEW